jgi:hypothetical protein
MKHLYILFIIASSCLAVNAQSLSGPESIEYDAAHHRYLISNTSTGQILARAANGTLSVFKSGISPAPYGLEILGNTVYACCGGFIKGFNLETGTQEFNLNLGATFLNGITTDGSGNLFATDFNTKKIFRIKTYSNSFTTMASNLGQSPNGICYDQANQRLVFVNWGSNAPIKALSLADSSVTTITSTTLQNCDGIVWNGLDTWYVTAWGGQKAVKFNANFTGGPTNVITSLSNPADIDYNINGDTLAIPNSGNNSLTFIGLPAIVNVNCNLLPLEVVEGAISFSASSVSFGDSVLRVPLLNASGLGFAYPLARLNVVGNLPSGMSFGNNQNDFNVFASAWNPDSIATAEFYFNVSEALPANTLLNFEIEITNLAPSSADTCFFLQQFTVNLNPDNPLGLQNKVGDKLRIYPNPASDKIIIALPNVERFNHLQIVAMDGKVVLNSEFMSDAAIDISKFKSGLYHVIVFDEYTFKRGVFVKL